MAVSDGHGHLDGPGVATGGGPAIGATVLTVLIVTMVLALVVVGVVLVRPRLSPRRFRIALSCSLVVAVAGLLFATVPAGGQAPAAGVPVLRALEVRDQQVPVLVVPNRPGFNLVGVSAPDAGAGPARDRMTAGSRQPGSTLTWVPVTLPAGASRLWVSAGGADGVVGVNTGAGAPGPAALAGADGPECASAVAGALLAGRTDVLGSCPADALSPSDAAALRSIVGFLAGRGEKVIAVAGDSSPRGVAAAAAVRAAAEREGLSTVPFGNGSHPVVVVAGWAGAESVLSGMTAESAVDGAYLAPWLATPSLLQQDISPHIALRYEPRDAAAAEYLAALGAGLPGEGPSTAGYQAWQRARGVTAPAPVRLYSAAVPYMPGMGGNAHQHDQAADWLPGGMIVPVTGPLNEL